VYKRYAEFLFATAIITTASVNFVSGYYLNIAEALSNDPLGCPIPSKLIA